MQYNKDTVSGINIAYIGGGSRGWAWTFMNDLALEPSLSGTIRLFDTDRQAAEINAGIGNRYTDHPGAAGKWKYFVADDLRQALMGADFVVLSILPGSFREMASDVHTPEQFGIYQSVGDTVGPGGIIRSLRTLPLYMEFAGAVKEYAPGAWVINYTNPMTLCTRMLYEVFPEIRAFGCCHEVFGTQSLLANMLAVLRENGRVPRQEIRVNVLGINHFTWITQAFYRDLDLMPLYSELVDRYYADGFDRDSTGAAWLHRWNDTYFTSADRVKFDLFKRYGIIAAAGDRHLAEFVPPWYLKDPGTAGGWKFSLTPVSWRMEDRRQKEEKAQRLASGAEEIVLGSTGEEGILLIKAILGLGDVVSNVNIPNRGQAPEIPSGAVVETNALFSRNSIKPLLAGRLPIPVHNLVQRQVFNQEVLLKAFLHKDREQVFNVFCNDPLVCLSLADAKKLFHAMLGNTAGCLPGWCLST